MDLSDVGCGSDTRSESHMVHIYTVSDNSSLKSVRSEVGGRLHPLTVITIFPEPEFYLNFEVGGRNKHVREQTWPDSGSVGTVKGNRNMPRPTEPP